MITEELINDMIPALKKSDMAENALIWMEELKTNELPVVEGRQFRGLISEDDILESNDLNKKIGDFALHGERCFIHDFKHFFEAIRILQECNSEIIAVLNEKNKFLGVTSFKDLLQAFAGSITIQSQGGIIILSLKMYDYSMAEIGRLVESNGGRIMGSYIAGHPDDESKIYLTLKINKEDLTTVNATLERFGYQVVAKFHESVDVGNEQERLDNFLKYLDI
jgi:CBS domain-containing protein